MASALALVFLLGGLLLMAPRLRIALRSPGWPQAAGTVVTGCSVYAGSNDSGEPTYDAAVVYRYSVAGREYQSSMIEGMPLLLDAAQVERKLRRYPPGRIVCVYYDPACPATAVLEPGLARFAIIALAVYLGVCVLLVAQLLGMLG